MYSNEPIRYYKNRRRKKDLIILWLELGSILVWFIFMFNISALLYARPLEEGFFDHLFKVTARDYWDVRFLRLSLIISIVQFVISVVSIYLNTKRMKRRTDVRHISFYISAILSLIFIIVLSIILAVWNA